MLIISMPFLTAIMISGASASAPANQRINLRSTSHHRSYTANRVCLALLAFAITLLLSAVCLWAVSLKPCTYAH